jgi:hypothetical protein
MTETICLNLIEATVTLYPANADGSPQLSAPIWLGAPAENLRGVERWVRRETTPSGAKYRRRHPLVAEYEVSIGRVWALPEDAPQDFAASYGSYVLDVVWVEEETQAWHRKTFYGVTIDSHEWSGKDVETGLIEDQAFQAQYMVTASGAAYTQAPPVAATLPYRVVYTGSDGNSLLLYTYDPTGFTAQVSNPGDAYATVTASPFAVQFAGDAYPVVAATTTPALTYRNSALYRNADTFEQDALLVLLNEANVQGIFPGAPPAADLPRLDFYYGEQKVFSVTRTGLYETDFAEGSVAGSIPAGSYGAYGGSGSLVAVFGRGQVQAKQINVVTD